MKNLSLRKSSNKLPLQSKSQNNQYKKEPNIVISCIKMSALSVLPTYVRLKIEN